MTETTAHTERNKALVRTYFERINARDLSAIDDFIADDYEFTTVRSGTDEVLTGPDGLRTIYEEYFDAFPDGTFSLGDVVAEDDRVAYEFAFTGTHEKTFRGVEPKGRPVKVTGATFSRIRDGEIVESSGEMTMLRLFSQLGVGLDLED